MDEAIDYYDDFIQVAPKDPNQYILRYQILRAQRAPIEQQIEALEEYKKSEYIEEWAYELAKLYQEAGMTAECLEECDDLILWFSEGQYVYKAMELKMQYKPLTPSQQEKYDRRYEKLSSETEEMPDLASYAGGEQEPEQAGEEKAEAAVSDTDPEEAQEDSGPADEEQKTPEEKGPAEEKESSALETKPEENGAESKAEPEVQPAAENAAAKTEEPKRRKLGDTMPLGEALRRLLHPESTADGEKEDEKRQSPL